MKDKKWRFYIPVTWRSASKLLGIIFGCWILYVFLSLSFMQRKELLKRSGSVEESKSNGAYLWSYRVDTTVYYDTLRLKVGEVFAEKEYYYKDHYTFSYDIDYNYSRVIMIFDDLETVKDSVLSVYYLLRNNQTKYIIYNTERYKKITIILVLRFLRIL